MLARSNTAFSKHSRWKPWPRRSGIGPLRPRRDSGEAARVSLRREVGPREGQGRDEARNSRWTPCVPRVQIPGSTYLRDFSLIHVCALLGIRVPHLSTSSCYIALPCLTLLFAADAISWIGTSLEAVETSWTLFSVHPTFSQFFLGYVVCVLADIYKIRLRDSGYTLLNVPVKVSKLYMYTYRWIFLCVEFYKYFSIEKCMPLFLNVFHVRSNLFCWFFRTKRRSRTSTKENWKVIISADHAYAVVTDLFS